MGSEERKELEIRKEKIILKFNQIVKNKEKWILFSLLAFTILYKLYYFFKTLDQAIWWDEGDYLALAKELYFPMVERPEWWSHFAGMRPLLMPLIWGFMFFIKLGEPSIRFFTLLLPSILSVQLEGREEEQEVYIFTLVFVVLILLYFIPVWIFRAVVCADNSLLCFLETADIYTEFCILAFLLLFKV